MIFILNHMGTHLHFFYFSRLSQICIFCFVYYFKTKKWMNINRDDSFFLFVFSKLNLFFKFSSSSDWDIWTCKFKYFLFHVINWIALISQTEMSTSILGCDRHFLLTINKTIYYYRLWLHVFFFSWDQLYIRKVMDLTVC